MRILTESGWKEVSSDSEQLDELTAPNKRNVKKLTHGSLRTYGLYDRARNLYHRSYQLKYPTGIIKTLGDTLDKGFLKGYRSNYANQLQDKARSLEKIAAHGETYKYDKKGKRIPKGEQVNEARKNKKPSLLPKIYGWRKKRNRNELEQINELTAPSSISKRGVRKVLNRLSGKSTRAANQAGRANYPSQIRALKNKSNDLDRVRAYGTKYDGK